MTKVILASSSVYRKMLLKKILPEFESISPEVDEEAVKKKIKNPKKLSQFLAREKALAIQKKFPDCIVIGSDQVVSLKNEILSKPGELNKAIKQISKLNGKYHQLYTSIYVCGPESTYEHTDVTKLKMKKLKTSQIVNYLNQDKPFDCAGSYKIEEKGITLFEKIECEDFNAITGLPLMALTKILEKMKINIL
ncbi:MAG: septum formation protein Maf [Bacteriovoracaceae bacterium]|nr:septum formation protein Maf [Bacteriovoracaceae bacterium]